MDLNEKIKYLRERENMTLEELAQKVGVSASTILRYETGNIKNLRRDKIKRLADALNTTPAYLMGWEEDKPYKPPMKGAIPVGPMANIPVLGRVSAGYGCLAEQEVLYYEPADIKYATGEYFFLVVKGDSMAPQIIENDLVLIKAQNTLDSGDLGVVIIDNMDGVIKKVIYDNDTIHLISFNPYYPERLFKGSDVSKIRIMGKVIESKRKW